MIAIDLSNSMLVEDIKPNRLEKSKRAISELLDQLGGDRIGLVVFGSEAYVQLPIKLIIQLQNSFIICKH